MTDTLTAASREHQQAPRPSLVSRLFRSAGWVLIWFGLLTFGFVLHQVYVTTWLAQQEQGDLTEQRIEYFAAVSEDVRPIIVDETGTPIADAVTGEPISTVSPPQAPSSVPSADGGDPPPPDAAPPSNSNGSLIIYPEPQAPKGTAFAVLRIPTIERLKDGWNVVEGVGLRQLRKGAGHMPSTPYPGQRGNSVISGHRTTYGAPFQDLDDLEPGDRIEVETAVGVHIYEVRDTIIVKPTALWVTAPDGPQRAGLVGGDSGAWLTLTTCNPKFSARQRLIVFAEMVAGPNFETIQRLTG